MLRRRSWYATSAHNLVLAVAMLAGPKEAMAEVSSRPLARANRLAITLGLGVGSASLSSYHSGVDGVRTGTERINPGATINGDLKSNLQFSGELSLRYYFPYHLLAQLGFGLTYNRASADLVRGPITASLDNHNLLMEVPILVGGYYTFFDRLYVHGAVGPSVLLFSRSFWDPGTDYEADTGVGMHVAGGADYLLAANFALGFELRYRLQGTGGLKVKGTNLEVTSGQLLGDGSSNTYDLDFSGITILLNMRLFAI